MNIDYLDLSHERSEQQLDHVVTDSRAWLASDVDPEDCLIPIEDGVEHELYQMAESITANPLPTVLREPSQFEIPNTMGLMSDVRRLLDQAPGIAVLDGMPLDNISVNEAIDIYWTIGQRIGRNVAQKWDGTMVYHVRDTGTPYQYGVRGSYTSVELLFHNDNAFGIVLPRYVGLMCLMPSYQGGISRFCSLYTIHNLMLQKYPNLLKRLYKPVLWDRQAEHADDEPLVALAPVFSYDGERLWTRANPSLILKGYEVAQCEMDSVTSDAVDAIREVSEDPSIWFELPIERKHLQFINNIDIAHYRSEIIDYPESDKKRHLIRTWHRDTGNITYDGQ